MKGFLFFGVELLVLVRETVTNGFVVDAFDALAEPGAPARVFVCVCVLT